MGGAEILALVGTETNKLLCVNTKITPKKENMHGSICLLCVNIKARSEQYVTVNNAFLALV